MQIKFIANKQYQNNFELFFFFCLFCNRTCNFQRQVIKIPWKWQQKQMEYKLHLPSPNYEDFVKKIPLYEGYTKSQAIFCHML